METKYINEIKGNKEEQKLDNKYLFNKQKELLDMFLSKNAITKEQYDHSLGCLKEKMKID